MGSNKATEPRQRKERGLGRDPFIGLRLPEKVVEAIDRRAAHDKSTRSQVIRAFIEAGLKSKRGP